MNLLQQSYQNYITNTYHYNGMQKQSDVEYGTKEFWQNELQDVKTVYVVGTNMSQGAWNHFNIFYMKDGKMERVWFGSQKYPNAPGYWSPTRTTKSGKYKGGYFECSAWGTNRILEIVYELMGFLGFHDALDRAQDGPTKFLSYQ